jgi:hypothetical protein
MNINSIRVSLSESTLSAQFTAHPIRGDIRNCSISLGEPVQVQLANPGFDGKVFWFFIPDKGGVERETRILVTGKTMVFENEKASKNPVLYVKVQ